MYQAGDEAKLALGSTLTIALRVRRSFVRQYTTTDQFDTRTRTGNGLCKINIFTDRHLALERSCAFYSHKSAGL